MWHPLGRNFSNHNAKGTAATPPMNSRRESFTIFGSSIEVRGTSDDANCNECKVLQHWKKIAQQAG